MRPLTKMKIGHLYVTDMFASILLNSITYNCAVFLEFIRNYISMLFLVKMKVDRYVFAPIFLNTTL